VHSGQIALYAQKCELPNTSRSAPIRVAEPGAHFSYRERAFGNATHPHPELGNAVLVEPLLVPEINFDSQILRDIPKCAST